MTKVFKMLQLALQHEKRGEGYKIVDVKVLESPDHMQIYPEGVASVIDDSSNESPQDDPGEEASADSSVKYCTSLSNISNILLKQKLQTTFYSRICLK